MEAALTAPLPLAEVAAAADAVEVAGATAALELLTRHPFAYDRAAHFHPAVADRFAQERLRNAAPQESAGAVAVREGEEASVLKNLLAPATKEKLRRGFEAEMEERERFAARAADAEDFSDNAVLPEIVALRARVAALEAEKAKLLKEKESA
mmetsp:Transcript_41435/g.129765  ORF Transcript_41435/g.129765 Transcript_41435/m.129765 type:complete len:152 (-) Transcript_41435:415-870(-)